MGANHACHMKLTKHGAIAPTLTPCLGIANVADMEAVRNCISAGLCPMHFVNKNKPLLGYRSRNEC